MAEEAKKKSGNGGKKRATHTRTGEPRLLVRSHRRGRQTRLFVENADDKKSDKGGK